MDELKRLLEAQQRVDQQRLETVQSAMQASAETFEAQFEFAPLEEAAAGDERSEKQRAQLGQGSFGTTYRVRARLTSGGRQAIEAGQLFAVKVVRKKDLQQKGMSSSDVEKEVAMQQRLQHESVIRLFRLFVDPKNFYLMLELAEGGTLAGRVCAALSASDVWRWTLQLARVLDFIHGQGMAHRDLKPENILLSRAGDVRIADFGLAKDVAASMRVSKPLSRVGTFFYWSPELGEGLKGSCRANDVWALGCIVMELLLRERLDGPIWSNNAEIVAKRSTLLARALTTDPVLGAAAANMLVAQYRRRCSAAQLHRLLDLQLAPPQVTCHRLAVSAMIADGIPWPVHSTRVCASTLKQFHTTFALNPQPSTLNPQPSTLNPQPSHLNLHLSTLNPQPSTLDPQPLDPSTPNTPPSAPSSEGGEGDLESFEADLFMAAV